MYIFVYIPHSWHTLCILHKSFPRKVSVPPGELYSRMHNFPDKWQFDSVRQHGKCVTINITDNAKT